MAIIPARINLQYLNSSVKPSQSFHALTGVRWLLASMVFVYHNRKYWRDTLPAELNQWLNEMHLGVSLFFVLSGFLIAWRYPATAFENKRSVLRYHLLRGARILPLYWLLLLMSYIDMGFPPAATQIRCFTLTHGFSERLNFDGIPQAWSLTVEMSFYLLAPWLLIVLNRKGWMTYLFVLAGCFAGAALTGYLWTRWNGNPQQFFYPVSFLLQSTFFGRCIEFSAGILLAQWMQSGNRKTGKWLSRPTLTGALIMLFAIFLLGKCEADIFHHGYESVPGWLIQNSLLLIGVLLFFYGLCTEVTWISRFFSTRLLLLLGNASFAFYLIHIGYVNQRIKPHLLLFDRNYLLLWLIAVLLYLLFEKPVHHLLQQWIRKF